MALNLRDPAGLPATIDVEELAELLGVRKWTVYRLVKAETCPVPPIRVGRKLRFSTAAALRAVGIEAPAA